MSFPRFHHVLAATWLAAVVSGCARENDSTQVEQTPEQPKLTLKTQQKEVPRIAEFSGALKHAAHLVAAVRPQGEGESWWVQDAIPLDDEGRFTARIIFGNAKTPSGSKFDLAFFSGDKWKDQKPGAELKSLPDSVTPLQTVTVTLVSETEATAAKKKPDHNLNPSNLPPIVQKVELEGNLSANAEIGRRERLSFTMEPETRPIVLVRANAEGESWWAQDAAEEVKPGVFEVPVRFGNEKTKLETPFQVVALVAPVEHAIEPGTSFKELPSEFPRTAEFSVILKSEESVLPGSTVNREVPPASETEVAEVAKPVETPELIQEPVFQFVPGAIVNAVENSEGVDNETGDTIVLIRSHESGSHWWVQDRNAGETQGTWKLRFGNEKTPTGSEFRLALVKVNLISDQELFQPGDHFAELPETLQVLKQVVVTRGRKALVAEKPVIDVPVIAQEPGPDRN